MQQTDRVIVSHNHLQDGPERIPVGSAAWFGWLERGTRFSYQGQNGHFTAQRETRRQKTFWYAYRRRAGKLYKHYLGKAEELTTERLEQASTALAGHHMLDRAGGQPARELPAGSEARIDTSCLPMSKVSIPALPPHLVPRPRLTRQMTTPLTVLSAPSGFGKSTLVNDWSRARGYPVAWLSLDASDDHAARFWVSVVAAFQAILPGFGKELLADLQAPAPISAAETAARLTNELARAQAGQAVPGLGLVLDDVQHLTRPEIFDALQFWLEHFPPDLRLVIAGHSRPALSLGHLRARGFLTELDAGDLRFTLEEGIEYLKDYTQPPPLALTDLEKLARHTEGWAAGLTLTALALNKTEDRRLFIDTFSGAHLYLREYFMETVLQNSSAEAQAFLLKTAILKHLTGSLCDAVSGQTGGEEVLLRLWQENLFLDKLEEPGWFRYHDLFAEMLVSQLQARFPGEVPLLHQRAAQWFREHNAPADAVYHLLEIEAWDEAAALIERMALRELEQYGEDSRLLRWLQALPEDVVQKHKTLLFVYLRLADQALPPQRTERFIARIEANLSKRPAAQQTQEAREVLAVIQRIQGIWEQGGSFTPPALGEGENEARWEVLNGLRLLRPAPGTIPAQWEAQMTALLQQAQAQPNLFVLLMVGGAFARRALVTGQLRRAEKIARQVLEQALLLRGKLPEPASIALAVLCQVALERGDLAQARQTLAQAQAVDPNPTSTNMPVQFAILRAKIQAAEGRMDEALANLRAVRALHARRPSGIWTDADLLAYEALIETGLGNLLSAERLLHEAESGGAERGGAENGGARDLLRLARAVLLRKNQPEAAEAQFARLVAQPPASTFFEPLLFARVQLALAQLAQHKIHQALQSFSEAVRQAAPEHFIHPFLESGAEILPLLLLALNEEKHTGEAQAFLQEILRALGSADCCSPEALEALSASASISQREQEVLRLLSGGYANRAMAEELCISESTVKTHLRNIYAKLEVTSRTQAVKRAKELRLV